MAFFVQLPQKIRPQMRQWCFLTSTLNGASQQKQTLHRMSSTQNSLDPPLSPCKVLMTLSRNSIAHVEGWVCWSRCASC